MHRLLKRQIDRLYGEGNALPESLRPLLEAISQTYEQGDVDRRMLERSLEIVSDEMGEQNRRLWAELAEHKEAEKRLEKSVSTFVATLNSTTDGASMGIPMSATEMVYLTSGVGASAANSFTITG